MYFSSLFEKNHNSRWSGGRPVWDLLGAVLLSLWVWTSLDKMAIPGRAANELAYKDHPYTFILLITMLVLGIVIGIYQFIKGYRFVITNSNT